MSRRLPRINAENLLRALRSDGWFETRRSGSHIILRHPEKIGRVVVPYHRGKTLKIGTLAAILEQAGISTEELKELL